MPIEALIFDVDGTLADTEEAHRRAFNAAFDRLGLGWHWTAPQYKLLLTVTGGKERLGTYIRTLPVTPDERRALHARVPEIHAAKTAIYTAFVTEQGVPLRPGVHRLLAEANNAGIRLGIASTTSALNIDALLRATLGADAPARFEVVVCGDEVRRKKPAPDVYLRALDLLGVPAQRAIAIEDSAVGLRSATAAGLWTLVTPTFWTDGGDFGAAGLVLPHLGDPAHPLPDEPGGRLRGAAWLGLDELFQHAVPAGRMAGCVRRTEACQ